VSASLAFCAEPLAGCGFQIHALEGGRVVSYQTWLARLREDPSSTAAFTACLAALPLAAFAWECRAVTSADLGVAVQMVAIDSPALAGVPADPTPFAQQLSAASGRQATVFENLGGDAQLLVPCAVAERACYAHLASFVRGAPAAQLQAFWRELARAVEARLQTRQRPLWVSTAGLGVSWLHVRLDDRPKYYRHTPFKRLHSAAC
jgi:hypothetical protein